MTRRIYAIYKDGEVKEIKKIVKYGNVRKIADVKVDDLNEIYSWIAEHELELKDEASDLRTDYGAPVLGFNLSGKVSDSLRKKIVKPTEL